jgi:deoxyribose-phosphate aldolase
LVAVEDQVTLAPVCRGEGRGEGPLGYNLARVRFDRDLARIIDHTLLQPWATTDELARLCDEARRYGFRTVCVQPALVAEAAQGVAGFDVGVTAVVSFPHGASITEVKQAEARRAVADGATEIDVVANLGWIRAGDLDALTGEVAAVVAAAAGAPVKVILETALWSDDRKAAAARAAVAGGAAFVKTSTGFGPGGASEGDVTLLRRAVGTGAGVKASGGIRTRDQALALVAAGADRIGASSSIELVTLP